SVHEVIAAVKRVSGVDFKVVLSPPRAGDPAAIVAASAKIRSELGWQPEHDDLDRIVEQALAWEQRVDQTKTEPATASGRKNALKSAHAASHGGSLGADAGDPMKNSAAMPSSGRCLDLLKAAC